MLSKDYQDHSARNKGPETGKIYKLFPHNSYISFKIKHILYNKILVH